MSENGGNSSEPHSKRQKTCLNNTTDSVSDTDKTQFLFNTTFEILPIDPSGRTWHLTSYSNLKRGNGMYYSAYFE